MDKTSVPLIFWSDVWDEGQIRFHQKNYNSHMVSFFHHLELNNKTVFIPLAGKSNDILYFLEKGAIVTAIEFVEKAVINFFEENQIPFTKNKNVYQAHNLKFIVADFFDYRPEKTFDVMYDRASQVVFNENDRPKYYLHMKNFIDKKTTLLLMSINHTGPRDFGPPYPISEHEIMSAYEAMNVPVKLLSKTTETSSEKAQAQGIMAYENIVLARSLTVL